MIKITIEWTDPDPESDSLYTKKSATYEDHFPKDQIVADFALTLQSSRA